MYQEVSEERSAPQLEHRRDPDGAQVPAHSAPPARMSGQGHTPEGKRQELGFPGASGSLSSALSL